MEQNIYFQNLCRLCTNKTDGISIYSKEGKEISLEAKINQLLSIQVQESDKLPKMVCLLCRNKLESIHKFTVMAISSQTKLLDCLNSQKSTIISDEHNYNSWPKDNIKIDNTITKEREDKSSNDTTSDNEFKGSLLHSILTKGHVSSTSEDITEMEVTVDPMLFFEEESDEVDKLDCNWTNSNISFDRETQIPQILEVKPYQCNICPRGFNSDLSLKNHLWNHLPSRKILATSDLNRFQAPVALTSATLRHRRIFNTQCLCQECGRIYPTKSTLRAHQITHSNLRPHKCSLCDKTFKRNQDLKFHLNQHTGERPYRCPYCPKAFASSGNCFSHRKRMHSKQLARDRKHNRH